jgi:hypothetical protein
VLGGHCTQPDGGQSWLTAEDAKARRSSQQMLGRGTSLVVPIVGKQENIACHPERSASVAKRNERESKDLCFDFLAIRFDQILAVVSFCFYRLVTTA